MRQTFKGATVLSVMTQPKLLSQDFWYMRPAAAVHEFPGEVGILEVIVIKIDIQALSVYKLFAD